MSSPRASRSRGLGLPEVRAYTGSWAERRELGVDRAEQGDRLPVPGAHNANHLEALDEIVAPDLTTHSPFPGLPPGLEGGRMAHKGAVPSFPDQQTKTEALIAEGDLVVERWTLIGTHTGEPFMGAPASGWKFSSTGISTCRIAGGRIVEHWGEFDSMVTAQQLGLLPTPGQ